MHTNVKGKLHIKSEEMKRLCKIVDEGRLNDSLIQFWMSWMLLSFNRNDSPIHCCNTYMYGQLIGEGMKQPTIVYDRVKKWSNNELFKKSVIFVPINLSNNHWIIAIIHNPLSIIKCSKSF